MGYYNSDTNITVTATLTNKGRELLAKGRDQLKITQYALSDDEIDYGLYNPAHPLGSDFYGIIIENLPLVEATPDESYVMRHKLVTLPRKTARIPIINVPQTSVVLSAPGQRYTVTPTTINFTQGNSTLGYTAILSNSDAAQLQVAQGVTNSISPTVPRYIGDSESAQSISAVGFSFDIIAKQQLVSDVTATLTIIGNETGGRQVINITVKKAELSTAVSSTILNAQNFS